MGYYSFDDAKHSVNNYIMRYYNSVRPHQHNKGLTPNEVERRFSNAY